MENVTIAIGGIPIQVSLPDPSTRLEDRYRPFLLPGGIPEYFWQVHPGRAAGSLTAPSRPPGRELIWEVIRRDGHRTFLLRWKAGEPSLWKKAVMTEDCSRGEIWTERRPRQRFSFPLANLDLLLFPHLLLSREGMIIHSAAVLRGSGAFLFPAPAGGGKSTWAALCSADGRLPVLGEDKVVVRKSGNAYQVFGTPWNPGPEFRKADSAPLRAIFFLHHGEDRIRKVEPAAAFQQLIQQAFLPFTERADLDRALAIAEEIIRDTPAYSFGFRPGPSAVNYWNKFVNPVP